LIDVKRFLKIFFISSVSPSCSAFGTIPLRSVVYHRGYKSDLWRFPWVYLVFLVQMGLQVACGI
jgi:hypothetical protein